MIPILKKWVLGVVLSLSAGLFSGLQGKAETVELRVGERVIGKTTAYLGAYGLLGPSQDLKTTGPSGEKAEQYIKDSGFNTTKFWLRVQNYDDLSARSELYGANAKATVLRQVTENPERIDWEFELGIANLEPQLDLCKNYGFQPVLVLIAPLAAYRTYSDEPLVREVFWRYAFLFHYWVNKVKRYNFILWSLGSENSAEASVMQAEVGSDAIRAAEKLTGVKVLVSAAGDDWTIQDIIDGFEGILKGEAADRMDALSFNTHNFFDSLPGKSEYATYLELVQLFDEIQRRCRPEKPLLPYWDTGGFWRTKPGSAGHQSDHLRAGLHYISRIIWANQGRVEVAIISRMYGAESDSLYGKGLSGLVKISEGSGQVRPGRSYFALRLIARATLGAKDILEIEGPAEGNDILALASRDSKNFYLTVINRSGDTTYWLNPILPGGLTAGHCTVREFSEKLDDQVTDEGSMPLKIELKSLSAKQIIIDL